MTLFLLTIGCWIPQVNAGFTLDELELALKKEPTNKPLLIEVAKQYHRIITQTPNEVDWKKTAVVFDLLENQFRIYERRRKGASVDSLALALFSSYKIFRGQRLIRMKNPVARRYAYTNIIGQGTADLDSAVETAHSNIEVRIVRALNSHALLQRGRMALAIEDFKFVIKACEKGNQSCADINLPDFYLMFANCYKVSDNYVLAKDTLTLLRKKYPNSQEAKKAEAYLKEIDLLAEKQREFVEKQSKEDQEMP